MSPAMEDLLFGLFVGVWLVAYVAFVAVWIVNPPPRPVHHYPTSVCGVRG